MGRSGRSLVVFLLTGAVLGAVGPSCGSEPAPGPPAPRPDVLLVLVDDMGWSDLGAFGGEIETPHLDALARDGVRFTQFYNTSKCWPSRAALLTGLHAQQVGVARTHGEPWRNAVTVAEVLRAAGYRTFTTGKHHAVESPLERGFERGFGLLGGSGNHLNPGLAREGEPEPAHKGSTRTWFDEEALFDARDPARRAAFPAGFYSSDAFTDRALAYLEAHADDDAPFFLYVSYTAPHDPLQAPAEEIARQRGRYDAGYAAVRSARHRRQVESGLLDPAVYPLSEATHRDWSALSPEERADEAARMEVYAAMVARIDHNVGRLVERLRELGRLERTLFLFASDNGASAVEREVGLGAIGAVDRWASLRGDWANVSNTPFRRFKNESHQGGITSPLIVHWPDGIPEPGRVSHAPLHVIDLMPTLLALTGAAYPREHRGEPVLPPEGESFAAQLVRDAPPRGRPLFFAFRDGAAVVAPPWKLVRSDPSEPWELYDLRRDATETTDVSTREPAVVRDLARQWTGWKERVSANGARESRR